MDRALKASSVHYSILDLVPPLPFLLLINSIDSEQSAIN